MSSKRIYIAGHRGMVGSALVEILKTAANVELILQSSAQLNLTNQLEVKLFFAENKIDEVYFAAAKVGGIQANCRYPAEFIYQNAMMECNIIHAAHMADVNKLLFLGSSCIYPRLSPQPIAENALLSAALEKSNEPYAVAKILGIKLCESYNRQYKRDYRCLMPTNLYGPNDNFHPENSHVIPALLQRFHEAKTTNSDSIQIWGTGEPRRDFLYVGDLAEACVHVMGIDKAEFIKFIQPSCSHINVGTGVDCTISELAETLAELTGFPGEVIFDTTKPDGTPRKLMDVSILKSMGWSSKVSLKQGLDMTYSWYLNRTK